MPASELLNQAIPTTAIRGAIQHMRLEKALEQQGEFSAGMRRVSV
jgi:hypothetical protein